MKDARGHGSNANKALGDRLTKMGFFSVKQKPNVRKQGGIKIGARLAGGMKVADAAAAATLAQNHAKCKGADCHDGMVSALKHSELGDSGYRSLRKK